jgi:hypothetical protein
MSQIQLSKQKMRDIQQGLRVSTAPGSLQPVLGPHSRTVQVRNSLGPVHDHSVQDPTPAVT